jgi:stringent starvation protein B
MVSTKPYLVKAIHEWCIDQGFTPYVQVAVDTNTSVPLPYVKAGEITLNVGYSATKELMISNDAITFSARFSGVVHHIYVPMTRVKAIFARENGEGLSFNVPEGEGPDTSTPSLEEKKSENVRKTTLKLVK